MRTVKHSSNYVNADGSYISDWRDSQGQIWERMMEISPHIASQMIADSLSEKTRVDISDAIQMEETPKVESWMEVGNKDFFVLGYADKYGEEIVCIYHHDWHNYLYKGNVERVRAYFERHSFGGYEHIRSILNEG
jgi:hypothetical protein